MAAFAYKARSPRGTLLTGIIDAQDEMSAAEAISREGAIPVFIEEISATSSAWQQLRRWLVRHDRVSPTEIMLFSRQMHTLLKAGIPIMRALAGLQESTANPTFREVLSHIRDDLDSGRELSLALARQPRVFSPFYMNMVRVGEMTGNLDEIFLRLFHHLEFEKYMRDQAKAAMRYPTFVMATMALALVVINIFVIPSFSRVYKGFNTPLPLLTQMLIWFSNTFITLWPLMIVAIIFMIFLWQSYQSTQRGRLQWHSIRLRLPIVGPIVMKAVLARFARSFALALKSGVPVVQTLTVITDTVDNTYVAERLRKMRENVERGESVTRTATQAGIFTPIVLQMIAVGEESGDLDGLMEEIADFYQREVEYELKMLSTQIEPILIIGLGILVLLMALGVFLPIWDLGQTVLHPK